MPPLLEAPLRLLVVMPSGQWRGGAEAALVHLAQARKVAGIEFTAAFIEGGDLPARIEEEGVAAPVFDAGRLRDPLQFARTTAWLRRLIAEYRPDAVLGWMTKAHLYGGLAARLAGVPALFFQMGMPDSGIDRLSRWIPARGVLTCSEFTAKLQRRVVRSPVVPVHLACEQDRFASVLSVPTGEMKRRLGFDPARPLVGIVGRLQHWKGMHVFAEAMASVFRHEPFGPRCQAVIVGGLHELEPDYPAFLERRMRELGVEGRIQMAGAQQNTHEWMQAMDLCVHASRKEPFGIVVIEAMSLGKAVIATKPGGPEEIITDGIDGLLIPHEDPAALAAAIGRLLGDAALREKLGAAARERAGCFSREQFALRLGEAVKSVL